MRQNILNWNCFLECFQAVIALGPFFDDSGPGGSLVENIRTKSRKLCIESIIASRPWANMVDLEILLAAFDWGERFARDNPCIQPRTETWVSLETGEIVADGTGPQAPSAVVGASPD